MSSSQPEKAKSFDFIVVIVKICILVIAIATLGLTLRPNDNVANEPITEDGYYALTVSRNIAHGNGPTIDGTTLTNGFQPLFTVLSSSAFLLAGDDKYLGVRFVLFYHWVFYILTAFLLASIGSRALRGDDNRRNRAVFWFIIFTYFAGLLPFKNHFNGLETGFYLFIISLTWWYYQSGYAKSFGGLAIFGALLGLVVFARVDGVFLVIVITAYLLISNLAKTGFQGIYKILAVPIMAVLVSLPWWYYNVACFGSLMPTSGKAQQYWLLSFERIWWAVSSFSEVMMHPTYFGRFSMVTVDIIRIILAILVVIYTWKLLQKHRISISASDERSQVMKRTLEFGGCLLVALLVLFLWYTTSSWATRFYARYFMPMAVISTIGIGYLLAEFAARRPRVILIAVFALCIPLAFQLWLSYTGEEIRVSDSRTVDLGNIWLTEQVKLADEYVPITDHVAAGQSGTLGYFRDKVVNLDGKVNPEILITKAREREQYMIAKGIKWLCDWPVYVHTYLGDNPEDSGWVKVAESEHFVLYYHNTNN